MPSQEDSVEVDRVGEVLIPVRKAGLGMEDFDSPIVVKYVASAITFWVALNPIEFRNWV